jgi:hypothetical protein
MLNLENLNKIGRLDLQMAKLTAKIHPSLFIGKNYKLGQLRGEEHE